MEGRAPDITDCKQFLGEGRQSPFLRRTRYPPGAGAVGGRAAALSIGCLVMRGLCLRTEEEEGHSVVGSALTPQLCPLDSSAAVVGGLVGISVWEWSNWDGYCVKIALDNKMFWLLERKEQERGKRQTKQVPLENGH